MSSKSKYPKEPNPWQSWALRDDRLWLNHLSAKNWSIPYCLNSLRTLLDTIVTPLDLSDHRNKFLEWMIADKEWIAVETLWSHDDAGPWSLPFFLSRAYLRFQRGLESVNSLTPPRVKTSLSKQLSHEIFNTFSSITFEIPAQERLSLELYLDGLLMKEIALLQHRSLAEVETEIIGSKKNLHSLLQRKDFGT